MVIKKCERCNCEHNGSFGSGRYCSDFCSRSRKQTEETKRKIGKALYKKKSKKKKIKYISDLSSRTITKVFNRLRKFENIGCSRCGWNKSTCDMHHINGRKIPDWKNHDNISYLCPNCHRLVHTKLVPKEELISITKQIGDKWKEYYYQ